MYQVQDGISFRRLDNGTPLAQDEIRIDYRVRENRIGSYGEMLLTGLCDGNLQKMGPAGSRRGE